MIAPNSEIVNRKRLFPQHVADLRRSGLSDETIELSGIYSETNTHTIADLLHMRHEMDYGAPDRNTPNPKTRRYGSCLVIPYNHLHDAKGNPIEYSRIKPDRPPLDRRIEKTGKPKFSKYLAPHGRRVHPYFPPGIDAIFNDASVPIVITEGEKKALAACQHGFSTVGLPGVECWGAKNRLRGKRLLHEDFSQVQWIGRVVFVVFDADSPPKKEVERAARSLRTALARAGAKAFVVKLPATNGQKIGLDDFLLANGGDALENLLQKPCPGFRRTHKSNCICPVFSVWVRARARVYGIHPIPPSYTEKTGHIDERLCVLEPDSFDIGKPCIRVPTIALTTKEAFVPSKGRKNVGMDGSCGRWDCSACAPRLKSESNQRIALFLSSHRLRSLSLLDCEHDKWETTQKRLKRKYGLQKEHFAYLRNENKILIASIIPIGVDEVPTPRAWETIKAFVRAMNPTEPHCCTIRVPEIADDEEEREVSTYEREGVYETRAAEQRHVLDRFRVAHNPWEHPPNGVTDVTEWDASMMTAEREREIKRILGLKQLPKRGANNGSADALDDLAAG